MNELRKKQYGLVLKTKKEEGKPVIVPTAALFNDEDDEEEKVDVSGKTRSAAALRTVKQAERTHELALAEDPTIFDYDASYDEIERKKNEKIAEQKKKDEVRQSKYAEAIIKSHARRELEKFSREERQQQRERETEAGAFDDKEVFITGAYREQMEAVAKFREEEAYEARFNALTAVEKQKVWQAGLSRTLLNDIARDGDTEKEGKGEKRGRKEEKKERNTRKALKTEESDEEERQKKEKVGEDRKEEKKKSIYDSDPEDESSVAFSHKNFAGELKPGLNRVIKKTKSQTVKERMFTPTPPSSDDERGGRGRGRREKSSSPAREDKRENHKDKPKEEKEKPKIRSLKDTADLKRERLERLKQLVARRNGPDEIEAMRLRYLERRDSGFVTLPL